MMTVLFPMAARWVYATSAAARNAAMRLPSFSAKRAQTNIENIASESNKITTRYHRRPSDTDITSLKGYCNSADL